MWLAQADVVVELKVGEHEADYTAAVSESDVSRHWERQRAEVCLPQASAE
jgi:hypothetical protein